MASQWIKIRTNLAQDPDVMKMSDILGIEDPTTVGHLFLFWSWADGQTADGTGIVITSARLDKLVGRSGFTAAMLQIGWLAGEEGNFHIPNYERHNGTNARARSLEAEAKRLRRMSDNTSDKCPTKKGEKVRPEKRREDIIERVCAREESPSALSDDSDLGRQASQVVDLYPRREKTASALQIVVSHLKAGESFETMLSGTRACAAVIRTLPSGSMNRYVPGAEAFFREKRWKDDPETLRRQGNSNNGSAPMAEDDALAALGGRGAYLDQ